MSEQALQERLKALKAEHERLRAHVFFYEGSIRECEFWLAKLVAPVEPPSTPAPTEEKE